MDVIWLTDLHLTWMVVQYTTGLIRITIFRKEIKKSDFLFKSDFFHLNQIMIYIRIFHFLLGYCSYNYYNYVNNLAVHPLLQE